MHSHEDSRPHILPSQLESFRPVTAEVDEMKITLAISNLVENAIKYNKENGWVHVSLNADHKNCYIEVADSGVQNRTDKIYIILLYLLFSSIIYTSV